MTDCIYKSPIEFLRKYVLNSTPCLFKDVGTKWTAKRKWEDRKYLVDKIGAVEVNISISFPGAAAETKRVTYKDLVQGRTSKDLVGKAFQFEDSGRIPNNLQDDMEELDALGELPLELMRYI